MLRRLGRSLVVLVMLALVGGYAAIGVFAVAPDEQAVILRLGRYLRTEGPGLHWYAFGLEKVETRPVTRAEQMEFGFRTLDPGPPPSYEDRPNEKRMITNDENLLAVEFVVQYRINDLYQYLFKVQDSKSVIRDVSETVMRELVALHKVDEVMTSVRGPIQADAQLEIQRLLDSYGAGVLVQTVQLQDVEPLEPVKDAFAAVASAVQDRERVILDARGYAEQVIPEARGEAERTLNQAKAYRSERILIAEGKTDRFTALLFEYLKQPEVTRQRLHLETLEEVLPGIDKVVIEKGHAAQVLPYLPVGKASRSNAP
ncbi:MAG: FtsH protease activity modulator HflK [Myxococcales bacterium]|nr:FtsH protease activity modulator HflK [Myxococcales bacterium]